MSKSVIETQTITENDNSTEDGEKSSWIKFCQKRGINPNLFMLKVTLFVMHGGEKN